MPYWRLYYHVVWSTAGRQLWLVGDQAELVEAVPRKKVHDHHGLVHAATAMPDHIHLAISLPPTGTLTPMIGEAKGASSFLIRRRYPELGKRGSPGRASTASSPSTSSTCPESSPTSATRRPITATTTSRPS